jgi:hypothetical protein
VVTDAINDEAVLMAPTTLVYQPWLASLEVGACQPIDQPSNGQRYVKQGYPDLYLHLLEEVTAVIGLLWTS